MVDFVIGEHTFPLVDHSDYKRIIYEPGRVTRIKFNRPRYQNALSHPHLAEIEHAFNRANADPECHVIVMSGEGNNFSAGDDTMGLTPESPPVMMDARPPEQLMKDYGSEGEVWRQFQEEHFHVIHRMHVRLREIMKPTIAMVHGYCIYNAFNMSEAMDLIFASEDALFLPVGEMGVWDWGPRKALELAYEHRFMTARECYDYGLVSRIYPNREILERETLAYANRVADNPMHANRGFKQQVRHVMDLQGFITAMQETTMRGLAYGGGAAFPVRDIDKGDSHRERYEGRGMARTPVAFAHLKAKFEGEGQPVPQNVLDALARAAARDDRGAWQKALTQDWREEGHKKRAEADAKAYDAAKADAPRQS